ncbi:MAG: translation elongation factor Ts [Planctomycetota bacterium]|jgi:elongation factor Ts
MADISAAAVKALREKTGLPLMDCKSALTEAGGIEAKAIELLRERGLKLSEKRSDRETAFGRFGIYAGSDKEAGAMVELKCESAPVAGNEEFIQLANDFAHALAKSNVKTAEELREQPSASKPGQTVGEQFDELFNRIREKFEIGRMIRVDGPSSGYSHNSTTVAGVLLQIKGNNDSAARDIAMHVAAMRPSALNSDELDPAIVDAERKVLRELALKEGKPENIVDKMVEGRLRQFFAEKVLLEQPFVKDDKQSVGQYAKANGLEVHKFVHYVLGETSA